MELFSQGGPFVDNLVLGTLRLEQVLDRPTPYHRPHSTQVAGYAAIVGGGDRYIGNVFVGGDTKVAYGKEPAEGQGPAHAGTVAYDRYPASFEEYLARIEAREPGDHQRFLGLTQPVYARGNVYAEGAKPFAGETGPIRLDAATVSVVDEGDAVYLETSLPAAFGGGRHAVVPGAALPRVRFVDADFEELDGTPVVIDVDLTGERRTGEAAAGP